MASGTERQLQPAINRPALTVSQPIWEKRGYLEIALVCVSILVFVSTLSFGFVYDDRVQVLDNPFIQSWRYLTHDFTSHVWAQTNKPAVYYRPVFLSWLRLNYAVFGTQAWGWHLSVLLIHAVVTVLVFRLALRVLGDRWQAAIAGLLFAVHPIHVESVAWISGAVDPLMALFFLGSLLCYLNWRERRSVGWMVSSLLLCFLAMLTKEPGMTLPAAVFLYAWIFAGKGEAAAHASRRFRAAVTEAAPFALAALVYSTLRMAVIRTPPPVIASYKTILLTLPGLLLFYLRLAVWPVGLSLFYDRQYLQHLTFRGFVLPLLLLALIGVAFAVFLRRNAQRREGAFAAAFALLVLCPALWVRWFSGDDFVHDRYLYLSSAGFAVLVAIAAAELRGKPVPGWIAPPRQMLAVAVVAVALTVGSVTLQTCWASDLLLWYHCYRTAPHNPRVLNNLASSLGEHGEYQSAVPMFLEAIRQDPDNADLQGNLGYTYYQMGALQPAEEHLSRAVRLDPSKSNSLLYLGITHYKLGLLAPAESELSRAIQLDPSAKGAHLALSLVLEQRGDLAGAIREAAAELAHHPGEEPARERLKQLRSAQ